MPAVNSRLSLLVVASLLWCGVPASVYADDGFQVEEMPALKGDALVDALQKGGYVLYLRHAATDYTRIDRSRLRLDDCTTQRNLSEKGREQSRLIGDVFRKLSIPVLKVMSSPYCRCLDTAKLAFGKAVIDNDLRFAAGENRTETGRLVKRLREMLTTPPPTYSNIVLVSHTANLKEATKIWPKPEGVVAVFKPLGEGGLAYFGLLSPSVWPKLVEPKDDQ